MRNPESPEDGEDSGLLPVSIVTFLVLCLVLFSNTAAFDMVSALR